MNSLPLLLSIDTSCDDTSAAVTRGTEVLSNIVASQTQLHKQFGGVFPTVAKQAHRENIEPVIVAALKRANVQLTDITAVAVTQGPGLAPALEVGIEKAKQLALSQQVPLITVNHIEGHALSPLAQPKQKASEKASVAPTPTATATTQQFQFPALSIVISGGHSEFILIKEFGQYERLGFTVDDAAGEALDKFGRMIDLGYPAGPLIEEFAHRGDAKKYQFPLPMTTSGNANLSFSGLKTSARNLTEELQAQHPLSQQDIYDLCASFQYSVFRAITYKLSKILQTHQFFAVYLGGGVAANMTLRATLRYLLKPHRLSLSTPYTKKLCMDNAAMIGVAAYFKWLRGDIKKDVTEIQQVERVPRWKIDQLLSS